MAKRDKKGRFVKSKKTINLEFLKKRIEKGIGSWSMDFFKRRNKEYIAFRNKEGHFVTWFEKTAEAIRYLKVKAKHILVEGRMKGFRGKQFFDIKVYTQKQAQELGKLVRKGYVLRHKDRKKRLIDLAFEKTYKEQLRNIKFTS